MGTYLRQPVQRHTPSQRYPVRHTRRRTCHQGEDEKKGGLRGNQGTTARSLERGCPKPGQGRGRAPEPGQAGATGRPRSRGGCGVKNATTILTNIAGGSMTSRGRAYTVMSESDPVEPKAPDGDAVGDL